MAKQLSRGDRVEWNSHGGKQSRGGKRSKRGVAVGTVIRKVTKPMTIEGHRVKASRDAPQYLVESDQGGRAAHHPSALRKHRGKKE